MSAPPMTSYANALVLLTSPRINASLNPLRGAHDKSHPRWPSHITLLFPFCAKSDLPTAIKLLREALTRHPEIQPFNLKLDKVGRFQQKDYETVYLAPSDHADVDRLWTVLAQALDYSGRAFVPHMTLGQASRQHSEVTFLMQKGNKLINRHELEWLVDRVCVLQKNEDQGGRMEIYEEISLGSSFGSAGEVVSQDSLLTSLSTFHFDGTAWIHPPSLPHVVPRPDTLSVATFNVLHDDAHPTPVRLSAIVQAIQDADADLLCLQELTDDFLPLLLQHPAIRSSYAWCNRSETSIMESDRNIVILSKDPYSFSWSRVSLSTTTKHKPAAVASFPFASGTHLVVAAVHFTGGLTADRMVKKSSELDTLLTYLKTQHPQDEWVIAGDTNWPSSTTFPHLNVLDDVWTMMEKDEGATYHPEANILAAATVRDDKSPQRYDRILIKRGGPVRPTSTSIFGLPEQGDDPPSDHWGLKAVLRFRDLDTVDSLVPEAVISQSALPLETKLEDEELRSATLEYEWLPSEDQESAMNTALLTLRALLAGPQKSPPPAIEKSSSGIDEPAKEPPTPTSSSSGVKLFVMPVGGFSLGVHTRKSDLDCLVIGNINPKTFWAVAKSRIGSWGGGRGDGAGIAVKLKRFVKDAAVQMMELEVGSIEVDLQYSLAPGVIDQWDQIESLPADSPHFLLPAPSLRTLNAYRDVLTLLKHLPSLDTFRLAHRSIKLYCSRHGLIGSRFGYFGGFHLTLLISRIYLRSASSPEISASQIIRGFFHEYANWDWEKDMVTPPGTTTYRRTPNKEPMVILSIERPQINVMVNANRNSMHVIKREFTIADQKLAEGVSWNLIVGQDPVKEFLDMFKFFVKVDVSYWGGSCMKGRALIGWLESRFVNLLVQLGLSVPEVCAQLWPNRFTDVLMVDDQSRDVHGFYLIGLSPLQPLPGTDKKARNHDEIRAAVLHVLRSFEEYTHNNEKYYDSTEMFVSLSDVKRSQLLGSIVVDPHRWADGGIDEEEDGDEQEEVEEEMEPDAQDAFQIISSAARKKKMKEARGATTYVPAPTKLRTSADVFNRLSWDPKVAKEDYAIGYEDRFKGIKEMPLMSWKREVEDEAFIPFHRVVYFKRKSDDVLVWDRKTKTDLLFGSGVGAI